MYTPYTSQERLELDEVFRAEKESQRRASDVLVGVAWPIPSRRADPYAEASRSLVTAVKAIRRSTLSTERQCAAIGEVGERLLACRNEREIVEFNEYCREIGAQLEGK